MGGRSAVGVAAAVWVGLLLGARVSGVAATVGLVMVLPLALIAARGPRRVGTIALLAALTLGASARGAAHRAVLDRAFTALGAEPALVRIEGRIAGHPLVESGEPVAVVEIRASDPPLPTGTRVRIRLPAATGAEWSDRISAFARLEVPRSRRNPGGLDSRAIARAADLTASGRVFFATVNPARGLAAWPRALAARWRRAVEARLVAGLEPSTRELVVPLVVGDRTGVPTDLDARLRAAGLIHLLALSGLHVAWMVAIARGLAGACGGGVRMRAVAGAMCALLYVAIAGPLPSLMRAAATEITRSVARFGSRALDPVQGLAVSALALLVWAPAWADDLGFQLSCAATLGLVTIGPALARGPRRWRALTGLIVPTLSAQIVALPLLLHRFHAVSGIAPIANLAAVPISGLLLSAAWLATLLELAVPGLGRSAFSTSDLLAAALRRVTDLAASSPGSLLAAGCAPAPEWLAASGAALLAIAAPPPRHLEGEAAPMSRARFAGLGLGAIASALALLLAAGAGPLRPPAGCMWLIALDVGQGDAIAIGFRDGWWLVDSGARSPHADAGESAVLPFLRWAGIRRLETLVLTHDDGDHTGGAPAVMRGVEVARLLVPPSLPGVPGPRARFGGVAAARGDRLHRDPDVRALWPPRLGEEAGLTIASDNAASLVLEVGVDDGRVLMLADADSSVERALSVEPGVALLKVAHHGSAGSSGARFLMRLRPRIALVSCGRGNPFGHPDPGALARLKNAGARIERTDRDGALWFEIAPQGVRRVTWREGAPTRGSSAAGVMRATRPAADPRSD